MPAASDKDTCTCPWPRLTRSRVTRNVDQHAPHNLRRDRKEMGAILPLHVLPVDQAQVGFVDQRSSLKEVVATLAGHAPHRDAPQFLVDERRQRLERGLVAVAPRDEQLRDIGGSTHEIAAGEP